MRAFLPAGTLAVAMLAAALGGCQAPWQRTAAQDAAQDSAAALDAAPSDPLKTAKAAEHAAAKPPGASGDPKNAAAANPASAAAGAAALADDRWVQVVPAPGETAPAKFRWRHFGLEAWLARGTWRPELAASLGDSQRVVATNAAIVLARDSAADARLVPTLVAGIDDVNLRLPLRFAAVEALACIATIEARARWNGWPINKHNFSARRRRPTHPKCTLRCFWG